MKFVILDRGAVPGRIELVVATNPSGLSRGLFGLEELAAVTAALLQGH
jgi:histidinol phosphatase-like enzyme